MKLPFRKNENPLTQLSPVQDLERQWQAWESRPEIKISTRASDVETATLRYLLYGMLPGWFVPGILDYSMHRRTNIEGTSGVRESVIHAMMMTEVGAPIIMALFFEVNPLLLTIIYTDLLTHEATAFWDVSTAVKLRREVRPNEQHIHSFLEVLPFMAASFISVLHWNQVQALFGRGKTKADWRLRLKTSRLSNSYMGAILSSVAAFVVLPYGEELWRCWTNRQPR